MRVHGGGPYNQQTLAVSASSPALSFTVPKGLSRPTWSSSSTQELEEPRGYPVRQDFLAKTPVYRPPIHSFQVPRSPPSTEQLFVDVCAAANRLERMFAII